MYQDFGIDPGRVTDRHQIGRTRGGITERALKHGGAELVEEGIAHIQPVDDALRAEIAVGQDRLGAVLGDDRLPARRDGLQRLVPRHPLELRGAFRADALQWIKYPLVAVDTFLVVVDLDAKAPARERMIGIAAHRNGLAVLDGRENRAGVRAIMWTRAYDGGA